MQKIIELIELEQRYQTAAAGEVAQLAAQTSERQAAFEQERLGLQQDLDNKDAVIQQQVSQAPTPNPVTPALPTVEQIQQRLHSLLVRSV